MNFHDLINEYRGAHQLIRLSFALLLTMVAIVFVAENSGELSAAVVQAAENPTEVLSSIISGIAERQ